LAIVVHRIHIITNNQLYLSAQRRLKQTVLHGLATYRKSGIRGEFYIIHSRVLEYSGTTHTIPDQMSVDFRVGRYPSFRSETRHGFSDLIFLSISEVPLEIEGSIVVALIWVDVADMEMHPCTRANRIGCNAQRLAHAYKVFRIMDKRHSNIGLGQSILSTGLECDAHRLLKFHLSFDTCPYVIIHRSKLKGCVAYTRGNCDTDRKSVV